MCSHKVNSDILSAEDLAVLMGFPARGQLRQEGMEVGEGLYKKLVVRLSREYLAPLMLGLSGAAGGMYQLQPEADSDWRDVAWWLGHTYNLFVDQPVVNSPDDLLTLGIEPGCGPHPSLRQAVLANLGLVREAPRLFFSAGAGAALRKAVKDALEVLAVRAAA